MVIAMWPGRCLQFWSQLFLFSHHFLSSQHVSSSPAVVHVLHLRLALTAAGAIAYRGKVERAVILQLTRLDWHVLLLKC